MLLPVPLGPNTKLRCPASQGDSVAREPSGSIVVQGWAAVRKVNRDLHLDLRDAITPGTRGVRELLLDALRDTVREWADRMSATQVTRTSRGDRAELARRYPGLPPTSWWISWG